MGRRSERQATLLRAKVFSLEDDVMLDCQIVDISENGARLYLRGSDVPS